MSALVSHGCQSISIESGGFLLSLINADLSGMLAPKHKRSSDSRENYEFQSKYVIWYLHVMGSWKRCRFGRCRRREPMESEENSIDCHLVFDQNEFSMQSLINFLSRRSPSEKCAVIHKVKVLWNSRKRPRIESFRVDIGAGVLLSLWFWRNRTENARIDSPRTQTTQSGLKVTENGLSMILVSKDPTKELNDLIRISVFIPDNLFDLHSCSTTWFGFVCFVLLLNTFVLVFLGFRGCSMS